MSSPGSVVTVELPRRLLAERLTLGLVVACALGLEATLARYPGLPQGPGLLVGGLLAVWHWRLGRHRPTAVVLAGGDVLVRAGGAVAPVSATGPRARILGRSVVLQWRTRGRPRTLWLTSADLPRESLRQMRVCCRTRRRTAAT
jgi:hypothetical protein